MTCESRLLNCETGTHAPVCLPGLPEAKLQGKFLLLLRAWDDLHMDVVLNSLFPKWPISQEKNSFRETFAEPSPCIILITGSFSKRIEIETDRQQE